MGKERLLVVDDEEDILELLRYNLEREGYAVITAESGEVAVELALSARPDLILLDLMLPGMNGLDVCRQLSRDDRTAMIPIVILTARAEEADIVAGLELGADDYVS
ncbi:MAG TPA: response regulator, partial [Myxococcota bacterium]|nr:response regulator [Myxococcota bacterium]